MRKFSIYVAAPAMFCSIFKPSSANVILGADFCHPMLVTAGKKARAKGFQAPLFEADALRMPIADEALDAIAVSFGFRNLVSYRGGLEELFRVLKPGGTLAILEFSLIPKVRL